MPTNSAAIAFGNLSPSAAIITIAVGTLAFWVTNNIRTVVGAGASVRRTRDFVGSVSRKRNVLRMSCPVGLPSGLQALNAKAVRRRLCLRSVALSVGPSLPRSLCGVSHATIPHRLSGGLFRRNSTKEEETRQPGSRPPSTPTWQLPSFRQKKDG